ncbi:acyl-CoA dehydrogenase family protein [Paraconexibacter antarcticus]|uniref:Acyl-CoA dehydrogenase family protein n=1 Tax=Paraconexibacter antarcticus TaxID=2949664 RepID=A0ABY5DPK9_9ACTN|nr:acyl-CoA dehydrogenase family protein [Paraconexibacter antarcticus]UTI62655.1 acyl-CoA dehydrogenase family protein [Paraconexibacter antarcticus]
MQLETSAEQREYRDAVRAWVAEHRAQAPPLHGLWTDGAWIEARRAWQGRLADAGYAGVTWPAEYGGQGLGPIEQVIVDQELAAAGVPNILDYIGLGMLGPCIMTHGTEAQKQRYIAPMLHGDEIWCQMFSEPAAGSDLAALRTRAKEQPDGTFVLDGQKVWTTNAQFSAFGLCLARTDPDVVKHQGLTMFVVPMDAEGVVVRGLRQISGDAEFNEVFLDGVRLGPEHVVGEVGGGWAAAVTVLMNERLSIGRDLTGFRMDVDRFPPAIAADPEARLDPEVRRRLGAASVELLAVRVAGMRALAGLQRGQAPGVEAGLTKLSMVKAATLAADLVVDVVGLSALEPDSEWYPVVSYLPGFKSAGGTEEIVRNTVGERALGLPPEPRGDKGVPFSQLQH